MLKIRNRSEKGLTLIELMVSLVILILLIVISAFFFSGDIIKSARDARRKADLDGLRKLLAVYYIDHGFFPTQETAGVLPLNCWVTIPSPDPRCANLIAELKSYAPKIPLDPNDTTISGNTCKDSTCYSYITPDSAHSVSCICAQLENTKTIRKPSACNSSGQNYCLQISF